MKRIFFIISLTLIISGCKSAAVFKTAKSEKGPVELTVTGVNSGTVKAEQEAELSFGAVGRVYKKNIKVGDQVKRNDILAELENLDLSSAVTNSKKDVERSKELKKTNAMSEQQEDDFELAYNVALTNYEKSLIRAPFDGLITEVNFEIGQLSQITAVIPKPLIKIIDQFPRYVTAEIDEVDLPKLATAQVARIKIPAVRKEQFTGKIRKIVQYVSTIKEQDRTALVEFNIDSEGVLLPVGASADVEIVADKKDNVLTAPSKIVLGRGADRYIFIYDSGYARKTKVTLGIGNYDRTEITSGLKEGEILLYPSESADLKDGMKVKID